MANNRAYIRFADGTEAFIAKHYPSTGWAICLDDPVTLKRLLDAADAAPSGETMYGHGDLELVFENHPDETRLCATGRPDADAKGAILDTLSGGAR